jgi:site-specific recombinase XerD
MSEYNPENERIKHRYFTYLKEAMRYNEATVDKVAKALSRFEAYIGYRDFKQFNADLAVRFKKELAKKTGQRSGERLSKSTLNSTLSDLKRFFHWLADQPGYKSRLNYTDSEYFNLSEKESRVARATRHNPVPTLEQIRHVINDMPCETEIERRNQAVIAFTILTGL